MKYSIKITACFLFLLSVTACINEQEKTCESLSARFCAICRCDTEAAEACGYSGPADQCESILFDVCQSGDGNWNASLGRTCMEKLRRLTCNELKASGKPDVCNRIL